MAVLLLLALLGWCIEVVVPDGTAEREAAASAASVRFDEAKVSRLLALPAAD